MSKPQIFFARAFSAREPLWHIFNRGLAQKESIRELVRLIVCLFLALFNVPSEFWCPFHQFQYLDMWKLPKLFRAFSFFPPETRAEAKHARAIACDSMVNVVCCNFQRSEGISKTFRPISITQNVKKPNFFRSRFQRSRCSLSPFSQATRAKKRARAIAYDGMFCFSRFSASVSYTHLTLPTKA